MILIFTDTQVYHNEWETNSKRISSSIVMPWASAYQPRGDYHFYDCFNLMQPYLTDEQYEEYIHASSDFAYNRAKLAYLISTGLDIVFLCNENATFLYDRLYDFLHHFQKRYGISPVYVKCAEDIPDIPRDSDYFNIVASGALEEDLSIIRMYNIECMLPNAKKEINDQIIRSECIL